MSERRRRLRSRPVGAVEDALEAPILAAQGIEFLRPLRSSPPLEAVHALLRTQCPSINTDRYLAPDIERATELITSGALARILRELPALPALWIPA